MKETQGQSWVIAAVQSSSSSYTFSLSLFLPTPPHPTPPLSHSLSLSLPLSFYFSIFLSVSVRYTYLLCRGTYGTTITVLRTLPLSPHTGCSTSISKFPEVEEILGRNDTVSRDMQSSSSKRRKDGNSYLFARAIYTRKMTKRLGQDCVVEPNATPNTPPYLYSPRDRNVRDKKKKENNID